MPEVNESEASKSANAKAAAKAAAAAVQPDLTPAPAPAQAPAPAPAAPAADPAPAAPQEQQPAPAVAAPTHKTIIVHRPYGETDTHRFIGFNGFERQIQYDKPVTLPVAVVNFLKSEVRAETSPDENGTMQTRFVRKFSISDVD